MGTVIVEVRAWFCVGLRFRVSAAFGESVFDQGMSPSIAAGSAGLMFGSVSKRNLRYSNGINPFSFAVSTMLYLAALDFHITPGRVCRLSLNVKMCAARRTRLSFDKVSNIGRCWSCPCLAHMFQCPANSFCHFKVGAVLVRPRRYRLSVGRQRLDLAERQSLPHDRLRMTGMNTAWPVSWRVTFLNAEADPILLRPRLELLGYSLWEVFPETV